MNPAKPHSDSAPSYFDLHIRGVGYLNRVRDITVKKSSPYLGCTIAALRGSADAVEKTYFDCRVVGEEAITIVQRFREASRLSAVLIGFRLGDPWLEQFTYGPGSTKAGQPGASIKARLLLVEWVKVDGVMEYQRPIAGAEASVVDHTFQVQGHEPAADLPLGPLAALL